MNIPRFYRAAIAISALFIGLAQSAQADIVTLAGDTTGGPTFDRPLVNFSNYSPNGTGAVYESIAFTVEDEGEYSITMHGLGFDTFLLLYETAFDPVAPLINGVVANDDLVSLRTSGFAADLVAGEQYFVVVTGFSSDQFGAYSLTISGDGVISAVPEPSTWLMLAFGVTAFACAQRRKSGD
ncbi:PEP-CTERM sorting domain-containing protein [Pseudoduganella umbonata]|uniref:PEP-CTERM sorting domain-containing protein n=1 Tax=Pseudoduganella umbonata TaxID=864828 RepID=A0A4P8HXW9_9BURK|nr:PEP-CTERM sorting domain-containing protein [Pseudoduganella umbonata]MBB3223312.1 hypothetical protein [Pseudoduganella umbonata]QCP13778.1 PEP-CTERM sorting domain-containing protein [Pseudoduganella umbonata]